MPRKLWLITLSIVFFFNLHLPEALAFSVVELKDVAFSYRPEAEPFFVVETAKMRNSSNGFIDKYKELEAYNRIYKEIGGQDMDFDLWTAQGGAGPKQFRIRARVKNYGNQVSTPLPITITLMAKVGAYFVDQQAYMVDQEHLQNTAKWVKMQTIQNTVPVLAGGETYDFFSEPVMFGSYLLSLEHQFPVALKATVQLNSLKDTKTVEIPVNGNHFALEDLQH
jgi:hypothetical protein